MLRISKLHYYGDTVCNWKHAHHYTRIFMNFHVQVVRYFYGFNFNSLSGITNSATAKYL